MSSDPHAQPPQAAKAPLPARRVADTLADRFAAMIGAGEIAEGGRFPSERDLMQRYRVSRTAVREAVTMLANRGLLLTRPGYRPLVRKPDYDRAIDMIGQFVAHLIQDEAGVRNLFETRIFLECALVRTAARNAGKCDLKALAVALQANHAAIGQRRHFYATDMAFHATLFRVPRNPIYPVIHRAYSEWLMGHWAEMQGSEDIDRLNYASHAAIYEAILARDPDLAEEAMKGHLETAWNLVRTTFRAESGADRG